MKRRKIPRGKWHEHLPNYSPISGWRWGSKDEAEDYVQWTRDTVYYDDIENYVQAQMDFHNRVVLILQGLLDRSPVFHPHPPWQLWTPEGFSSAMELVYDDSRALVAGDAPDFEVYRAWLNSDIKVGSHTVGQDDAWARREAERENERRSKLWRLRYEDRRYNGEHYRPYGDPGPAILTVPQRRTPPLTHPVPTKPGYKHSC